MTNESYHKDFEYLSKSFLTKFSLSPLHAFEYMTAEKKDSEAMRFGRVYHAVIAGLNDEYCIFDPELRPEPDKTFASTLNKTWKAEIEANYNDVISKEDHDEILTMLSRLKENEIVKKINAFSLLQEEPFRAVVEGRKIKCKPDGLQIHRGKNNENLIIDWKTCTSIHPDSITREVVKYGYDVQAAMYCDIISEINGGETNMLFIFQEKSAPYDVLPVLVNACSYTMEAGRAKYQKYYDEAVQCFASGVWPGIASKYMDKCLILE
jgi:hypothetical protein